MTDAEAKRTRIKDKIAASQERLQRDRPGVPARPQLEDRYPPEDYRSLAGEYPWLTVAGGLAAGVLIGALLPKSLGGKLGSRALSAATVVAELGLALGKQAGDRAGDAGRDGIERLGEGARKVRTSAGRAAGTARSTGTTLAREAIRLAARVRR